MQKIWKMITKSTLHLAKLSIQSRRFEVGVTFQSVWIPRMRATAFGLLLLIDFCDQPLADHDYPVLLKPGSRFERGPRAIAGLKDCSFCTVVALKI
jgi:hypothetical protein